MTDCLTASQLVQFQRCAEFWRRRYLDNDRLPPAIPVHIGHAVRKTILLNLHHKRDTGSDLPPETLRDAAADAYRHSLEQGVYVAPEALPSARDALASGQHTVLALVSLFREETAPRLVPAAVERVVMLDASLPLPIRVTLDCLTELHELHHFATASRRWSADRADTIPAPALRREAVRLLAGLPPREQHIHVLVGSASPQVQTLTTPRGPEDLLPVLRQFRLMLDAVAAGIFPPASPEHWICSPRWCGYFYACPYVPAHRKILPAGLHGVLAARASAFAV